MFTPSKCILATAVTASAVCLPATAGANMDEGHVGNVPSPAPALAAPAASESGFQWADAGLGAGGALVVISTAGGSLVLARRSRHASQA